MIADSRKGKQMYDKELQSFNLRSSVLIRVSSDKYYSVKLCVTLWWVLLISYCFELSGVCHCYQSLSPVLIKLYLVE